MKRGSETQGPSGTWIRIDIENRHREIGIDKAAIREAAKSILKANSCTDGEMGIVFTDDEDIRRLNMEYRKKNSPTDVLSFSMREGGFGDINPSLLGDVVISLDMAKRQAEERGETMEEEVKFLLIHGILHLLGFDHERSPEDAKIMRAKEKELLKLLKI